MHRTILKKTAIAWGLLLWTMAITAQVNVTFADGTQGREATIKAHDTRLKATIDANGKCSFTIPKTLLPAFATLSGPYGDLRIYVDGQEEEVLWPARRQFSFRKGHAKANHYLNDGFLSTLKLDYRSSDTAFICQWQGAYSAALEHLQAQQLPEVFNAKERLRLYYAVCNQLIVYPITHSLMLRKDAYTPSARYYETLSKAMYENPEAYGFWEYRQAFRDWIRQKIDREKSPESQLERLGMLLKYVGNAVKDTLLAAYLTDDYLTYHIRHFGIDGTDSLVADYPHRVKSPRMRAEFNALIAKYRPLAHGSQAPEFALESLEGNTVSLSELRGKYVYIDVWATWCVPCRREFPHLKALEKQFEGTPIAFLSVSIDSNKQPWADMVRREKMAGIQLYSGNSGPFFSSYRIGQVPRFILIDPEGRIIDANMTRPSNPLTANTLKKLIGNP